MQTSFISCTICHRDVRRQLPRLFEHCDTYHYGQSPDLVFPSHGTSYVPMDQSLKRRLVVRGEQKMGSALIVASPVVICDSRPEEPAMVVIQPAVEITYAKGILTPIDPKQIVVAYLSSAWEELICQGWVTAKIEIQNSKEVAVMERL